jgi:hypothetical protein
MIVIEERCGAYLGQQGWRRSRIASASPMGAVSGSHKWTPVTVSAVGSRSSRTSQNFEQLASADY